MGTENAQIKDLKTFGSKQKLKSIKKSIFKSVPTFLSSVTSKSLCIPQFQVEKHTDRLADTTLTQIVDRKGFSTNQEAGDVNNNGSAREGKIKVWIELQRSGRDTSN